MLYTYKLLYILNAVHGRYYCFKSIFKKCVLTKLFCWNAVLTRHLTGLPWSASMKIKCFLWVSHHRKGQSYLTPCLQYEFNPKVTFKAAVIHFEDSGTNCKHNTNIKYNLLIKLSGSNLTVFMFSRHWPTIELNLSCVSLHTVKTAICYSWNLC